MTFVGYDDEIKYDFNNDGKYSNHDNSGNLLPVPQWEVGAVKLANTNGPSWQNNGFVWLPYRFLNTGLWEQTVWLMKGKLFEPKLTLKAVIKHDRRNQIKITALAADNASDTSPKYSKTFSCFNYQAAVTTLQAEPVKLIKLLKSDWI